MALWLERWPGWLTGIILTVGVLADLLRPPFVAVNLESLNREHAGSPIVSGLHALVNLTIIVPPLLACWRGRADLRRSGTFCAFAILILLVVTASLANNPYDNVTLVSYFYVITLGIALAASALFAGTDYAVRRGHRDLLATIAVGCSVALVGALAIHEFSWGRLVSRAGPTYWGMISVMVTSLAVAIERRWLRVVAIALAWIVMLLASARGAMVASILAAGVQFAFYLRKCSPAQRTRLFLLCGALALIVPFFLPLIADKVFSWSDPRRGINSGATGRAVAWQQALALFYQNPLIGVGYRQHEHYITAATSAHEAYLAMLAETGITGLAVYACFLFGALFVQTRRAWRNPAPEQVAAAAFLWSYVVIGLTENLALATGLPMPMTLFFVAAMAWTRRQRRHTFIYPPMRSLYGLASEPQPESTAGLEPARTADEPPPDPAESLPKETRATGVSSVNLARQPHLARLV